MQWGIFWVAAIDAGMLGGIWNWKALGHLHVPFAQSQLRLFISYHRRTSYFRRLEYTLGLWSLGSLMQLESHSITMAHVRDNVAIDLRKKRLSPTQPSHDSHSCQRW